MPHLDSDADTPVPTVLVATVAGRTTLTVTVPALMLWALTHRGPFAAEPDSTIEHPLSAGRPVAVTDSGDPLTRWEVEQVAHDVAVAQQTRRDEAETLVAALLDTLVAKAGPRLGDDLDSDATVTVTVDPDAPQLLLEWLNRQYVRLRTAGEDDEMATQVGAAQSAGVFLGLGDEPTLEVGTEQDALRLMVAMSLAACVETLSAQLYR